ncbi:MAG TPA: hypothetical protein VE422_47025 [Terriglobia bacterium]|nr:hypothetical protein [Terriglobia bacterium]
MKALLPLCLWVAPCKKIAAHLLEFFNTSQQVGIFTASEEDQVKMLGHEAIDCEESMFFGDFFQNVDEKLDNIRVDEEWFSLFETNSERSGDSAFIAVSWQAMIFGAHRFKRTRAKARDYIGSTHIWTRTF